MIRLLYQWLLWLHPPQFRREFAAEMLWIYETSAESEGAARLFFDAFVSLSRQWLLRTGSWKIGAALAGGLVQITLGGLGIALIEQAQLSSFSATASYRGDWVGRLEADGAAKPIELALGRNPNTWFGSFISASSDGVQRADSVLDFHARQGAVAFRVTTPDGELLFHGALRRGKLVGTFEKLGSPGAGAWEVARPPSAAAIAPEMGDLIGITVLLVPGVMVSVILLVIWTRSFTRKRSRPFRPVIH